MLLALHVRVRRDEAGGELHRDKSARRSCVTALSAVVILLALHGRIPAADAIESRPEPKACPGGRFIVSGQPLLSDPVGNLTKAISLVRSSPSSVDIGCGATVTKVRSTKRFDLVRAR